MQLNLSYPSLIPLFDKYMKGGTETRAFLAWFLENFYRLEDVEIYDALCDGTNDKGIDGVYVNKSLRQIDFLQVTILKADEKTLGDKKLKQFAGSIAQFSTKANAEKVLAHGNKELIAIADRLDLLQCIDAGYEVRGVFVTNAPADASATTYLSTQSHLTLYDGVKLKNEFVTIDKTDPIATPMSFDISDVPSMPFPIGTNLKMIIAPIAARELVAMDGIANGDLFAWNVRQWLGKNTAVNKSVAETIVKKPDEHKYFPAFHNGITILCRRLAHTQDKIDISGYAVVNGCQSITSLYENRSRITPDLRLLTKFIEIEPDTDLATKITDHTNNQNGTTARDLQSNSPVQTRLQSEIHSNYPDLHYRIKRGEHPEWPKEAVIENELLARIILAFDLNRPESWSQNYKLFDELHAEIFARPDMTADRAVFLHDTYNVIQGKLHLLDDGMFADYTLTRWLVVYLIREAILTEPLGVELFQSPSQFFREPNGRERVKACIGHVAQNVVRLLNGEVKRRQASPDYFDYKKDLKNRDYVGKLCTMIIPHYQIILDAGTTPNFAAKWKESMPSPKPGELNLPK